MKTSPARWERGVPMNYGWLEVPPACTESSPGLPGDRATLGTALGRGSSSQNSLRHGVLSPPPFGAGAHSSDRGQLCLQQNKG